MAFVMPLHHITLGSGEEMSIGAIALINGYPVDSDHTWLSAGE